MFVDVILFGVLFVSRNGSILSAQTSTEVFSPSRPSSHKQGKFLMCYIYWKYNA